MNLLKLLILVFVVALTIALYSQSAWANGVCSYTVAAGYPAWCGSGTAGCTSSPLLCTGLQCDDSTCCWDYTWSDCAPDVCESGTCVSGGTTTTSTTTTTPTTTTTTTTTTTPTTTTTTIPSDDYACSYVDLNDLSTGKTCSDSIIPDSGSVDWTCEWCTYGCSNGICQCSTIDDCDSGYDCIAGTCVSQGECPLSCTDGVDHCWIPGCDKIFCWGDSAGSYTCQTTCAPNGKYAPTQGDCCSGSMYAGQCSSCDEVCVGLGFVTSDCLTDNAYPDGYRCDGNEYEEWYDTNERYDCESYWCWCTKDYDCQEFCEWKSPPDTTWACLSQPEDAAQCTSPGRYFNVEDVNEDYPCHDDLECYRSLGEICSEACEADTECAGTNPDDPAPCGVGGTCDENCICQQECTVDGDCEGNPNGEHCCDNNCHDCCVDDDCPLSGGVQMLCCSPDGTGCPVDPNPDYACQYKDCESNDDCEGEGGAQRCCPRQIHSSLSGSCADKGDTIRYNNIDYLCDPGTWFECNEDNINTIQEFEGYKFKCIKEDNEFKWTDISGKEETNINPTSIFTGLINRLILFVSKLF